VPLATGTQFTATVNPSVLGVGCNNLAFIRDVSYPSGTVVSPGENFNKTWKVMNNGTCDWLYQYSLEFLSANYPEGGSVKLGRVVTVNDWAEISVNIDARKNPGTYTSYWRMSDGAGHMFGATLMVSYVVE
jgi:next-to-BRCA1 protein 1